jgi:hypothetical protein
MPFLKVPAGSRVIYQSKPVELAQTETTGTLFDENEESDDQYNEDVTLRINRLLQTTQIETLYDQHYEIWECAPALQRVSNAIRINPTAMVPIVVHHSTHPTAVNVDQQFVIQSMFSILDAPLSDFLPPTPDHVVAIEAMSSQQRAIFEDLRSRGVDIIEAINTLHEFNFDEQKAFSRF